MSSLDDATARQLLQARLLRLTPETRPQWGRMSACQMICHLSDSFLVCLGEKPCTPAGTKPIQRTAMRWIALYLPLPWPKNIPTRPEVTQGLGGTPPGNFEEDRSTLTKLMERFSDPACRYGCHPFFGHMSYRDWMRWGYLHTDHHLRQFGL